MMQNRVFAVYFSIILRNAICATEVIASASSRTMSLKLPNEGVSPALGAAENICFVPDHTTIIMGNSSFCFLTRTRKCLDLLPYHINASVVTGIELQYHLAHIPVSIYSPC